MELVIAFIALAIAGGAASYYFRQKRLNELRAQATALGWTFSGNDPFGLLFPGFELFRRGDGRGIENVMWGERDGHDLRAFEYWYYEESTDHKGNRSRSYSRFSCAVVEVPMWCPATSISPESFFTRLADAIGFRDIEFESEEFNRRLQVKSEDERFASYLIDARMMQWLLDASGWTFMLSGNHLLAVIHRLRPTEYPLLIDALLGFNRAIPSVAMETYGKDG